MDRYRQLSIKKKMKEEAVNDMIIQKEKMNIALEKLKNDHSTKIKEMEEMEEMEIYLINERKQLAEKNMKMELDRLSMETKKKNLDAREKRLTETRKQLSSMDNYHITRPPVNKPPNKVDIKPPKVKTIHKSMVDRQQKGESIDSLERSLIKPTVIRSLNEPSTKTIKKKRKKKKKKKKKISV